MIVSYGWKNRLVEYKSCEYPWNKDRPYYFAVPIWLNDNNKLECRRAWWTNMFVDKTTVFDWYSEEQLQEIKNSCEEFLNFQIKIYKEYEEPKWNKEDKLIIRYRNIVNNFDNYDLNYFIH